MKDGAILGVVKRIIVIVRRFDHAVVRWLSRRAPYVLGGACCRSGVCCEAPGLRSGHLISSLPILRRTFLAWHHHVNGFELVETRELERTFVFRCTHFDRHARLCDSYATRPFFCRDYPTNLLDQPNPVFHPGCGHRPVAWNAAALRAELLARDLTPEQRAALERDLHLG